MILQTGADNLPLGQVAILRSRAFPPLLRTHCVSFWYYQSGSEPGEQAVVPSALSVVWGARAARA